MTRSNFKNLKARLNFWVTNLGPRRRLSTWMGYISRIRSRRFTQCAMWIWNRFDRLELEDAPKQNYLSIQECFTRPIRPETRPVDERCGVLISPCDGILGAHGPVLNARLFQIKGKTYELEELIGPIESDHPWRDGYFVTIRIKSNMYHRFHAPCSGQIESAKHFPGDAWNVNPETLERVDRLFVKNERACLTYRMQDGQTMALVPVAAILVAGIRVHALNGCDWMLKEQPTRLSPPAPYTKAQEMGWFEHGSTILMIVPKNYRLRADLQQGDRLKMGQGLLLQQDICT